KVNTLSSCEHWKLQQTQQHGKGQSTNSEFKLFKTKKILCICDTFTLDSLFQG
ncbi:hypothetical protein KI387_037554, partial [Taxus chinensis]